MVAGMLLAAGVGATIRLETQGPDEAEAMTAFRRAAVTAGLRKDSSAGDVAVQRAMKPGTNSLSCGPIGRNIMDSRCSSLCPSPFRAA